MNRSKFLDPRADSGRTLPNIGSNSSLLCGADKCRPNLEVWKDIEPLWLVGPIQYPSDIMTMVM